MTARVVDGRLLWLSRWAAIASGIAAAVGLAFLIAMFAAFALGATSSGMAFGRINDVLVLVSYLLVAPIALTVHALVRPGAPVLAPLVTLIGIGAIAAIVILQWLLVSGALTFEEQVGPVSIALLVLGAWLVVTGFLARSSGALPNGVRMGFLAATYVGFPIWAFWMARRLRGSPGEGR
jgi:hypothetical protein